MPAKRPNSGRQSEHGRCEDYRQIDVRRLAREGHLASPSALTWSWSSGAFINLRTGLDEVRFIYRYRRNGGEWRDVDQRVDIARTRSGKGNAGQPYFGCPVCGRRCRILYLIAGPVCRKCGDLRYASQSDCETNRSWGRTYKLEAKLSSDGSKWDFTRPPHMHWKTFERLRVAHTREMIFRDQQLEAALIRIKLEML
jgi:hypothetical protein